MADPRDAVNHEGIGYEAETFPHDDTIVYSETEENGSVSVGLAVTVESDNLVTLVGDGEGVLGKLVKVESDGYCVVQTKGNMTLPGGASATLTAQTKIVGDLGAGSAEGYIRSAASAQAAELLVAKGEILDASDTANVIVKF